MGFGNDTDQNVIVPVQVEHEVVHKDGQGNLIVKIKTRTPADLDRFNSSLKPFGFWKDLRDYDAWRIQYCEQHRKEALDLLRRGEMDFDTLALALKLVHINALYTAL